MEGIKGQATLWVLVMTVTLAVAGFSLPSPVLAPLMLDPAQGMLTPEASDWSRKVWLGVIMGLYPLFQLVGSPWLGRLSDRHGRKPILTVCLVGVLVGYALMALGIAWRSLPLLLLSRVVEGFFNGDIAIVQAMAADMSTTKTKARSFAWINIGMNLGWVLGPMIGGYAAVVSGDYSLAAWLGSRLARHWRGSSLGVVGHLVMAAGMLMFVLPDHWWGLALTFIPVGIGMSLGELATSVAVSNRSHAEQQGQAMGIYRGLAVGSEILAVLVGSLVLLAGTEWPFYLAALSGVICAIGFYGLRKRADRRQRLASCAEPG
ncbi:Multidrug resistance protein MdtG [Aeromonas salmonicida]|uniref:MFS transporter n=1 Tax=Aeromonas salmonicida TaxID=645 RepID=UPI00366E8F79